MFEDFKDFTVTGDTDIVGKIGGSGPPVLLLHGYPQNHWEWARVAPRLAERYTVVCTDLRGYGASGKPPAEGDAYSFRRMARDQFEAMRSLGFERFHLVGHDRGARTAHRIALDHSQALRSLAVLDIVPTLDMFERVDAAFARAYWHWFFLQLPHPFPEQLIASDPDHFYEASLFALGQTSESVFDPRQLRAYRESWR